MKPFLVWSLVIAFLLGIVQYFSLSWLAFLGLLFVAFLASGGPTFPKVFFCTFYRDLKFLFILSKGTIQVLNYESKDNYGISELLAETVNKFPNKTAFQFEDRSWTFREVDEYTNRVANIFKSKGFEKGDVVALLMENRPEYVFMWLGLSKIGVVTSLINFNLRLDSLLHCVKVCHAKALIFSGCYTDAVNEIIDGLPTSMQFFVHGESTANVKFASASLDQDLKDASSDPPIVNYKKSFKDVLVYIFTSGTTGLPKAAPVNLSRFFCMGHIVGGLYNVGPNDVIYCALPLYHTTGGAITMSFCTLLGATVVISRKFSASRFFKDCVKYNVTVIQYIGEMCRYLLAQPNRPTDKQSNIRLALGNGLRAEIWPEFQSRFKIKQIGEGYGSTEGNVAVLNTENVVGSCGHIFAIFPSLHPAKLIRIDPETGEIVRNKDGLAIQCQPGEPGQFVGKIVEDEKSVFRFTGYLNKDETAKKIARNVFTKGDSAFLSGDLVTKDDYGNVYFLDRSGDTFRWRGENVSTTEVESVITKAIGLYDVIVYGVSVPHTEGKAGMAAIADPNQRLDVGSLGRKLESVLPVYARPMFVRIGEAVQLTGTFKFQKNKLKKEGFDIHVVKDLLYYFDLKSKAYVDLDEKAYSAIMDGKMRL